VPPARRVAVVVACAGVLVATLGAKVVAGQPFVPKLRAPVLLRLVGAVEPSPGAAAARAPTVVSLGFTGAEVARRRWLAVDEARTVGGDSALLGMDVLNALAPATPNLVVVGVSALVRKLVEAPDGARVRVEGMVSLGSRLYYLRSVAVEPAP
jgi:hypothetical protein